MRWIASMVADVHRILTRGGIFMYPADKPARQIGRASCASCTRRTRWRSSSNRRAALRRMVTQRILDVVPQSLHERIGGVPRFEG
jgi:fructose-1,6-bisphosphatase I